jgi:IS6 family transposase
MNPFKGRHFQRDIILWAVRWYCKYGISYRELQEMLAERGVNVDHPRFTAGFSVMRLKWKNGCAGTGVTFRSLPVAHG